jgi:hypothetical protein
VPFNLFTIRYFFDERSFASNRSASNGKYFTAEPQRAQRWLIFFSLPLRRRQRKMFMTFPPARKRGKAFLYKELTRSVEPFPFLSPARHCELRRGRRVSAEKGKNYLLGDLCVSSPRRYLRGRAVRIGVLRSQQSLTQIVRFSVIEKSIQRRLL